VAARIQPRLSQPTQMLPESHYLRIPIPSTPCIITHRATHFVPKSSSPCCLLEHKCHSPLHYLRFPLSISRTTINSMTIINIFGTQSDSTCFLQGRHVFSLALCVVVRVRQESYSLACNNARSKCLKYIMHVKAPQRPSIG
jgi:hypothetical protein